jgi:CRP-like cAMP-binding protein
VINMTSDKNPSGRKIFLRYLGGGGIIAELNLMSLEQFEIPFPQYKSSIYLISGICNRLVDRDGNHVFVSLFNFENKVFFFSKNSCLNLLDGRLSISRKTGFRYSTVQIIHDKSLIYSLDYKPLDEVDDVFSYVETILTKKLKDFLCKEYYIKHGVLEENKTHM